MMHRPIAFVIVVLSAWPLPVRAQIDVVSIGPNGGIVHDIQPSPHEADVLYAVGTDRVFRTIDDGETWKDISPSVEEGAELIGLFVSRDRAGRFFLATTSDDVLRSDDEGSTWEVYYSDESIRVFYVDPDRPKRMWGHRWAGLYHSSLYRSPDGGRSWHDISPERDTGAHTRVWVNPFAPDVAIASSECCGDVIHEIRVYSTTDGGNHWRRAWLGAMRIERVVFDPRGTRTGYAVTREGLWKTRDAGGTWIDVGEGLPGEGRRRLAVAAGQPSTLYLAAESGHGPPVMIYRSEDGGRSWGVAGTVDGASDPFAVAASADDPAEVFVGAWPWGILRSIDGARSWHPRNQGLSTTSIYEIAASTDGIVAAGVEGVGIATTSDDGGTWETVIDNRSTGGLHLTLTTDASGTFYTNVLPGSLYLDDRSWAETGGIALSGDGGRSWEYRRGILRGPMDFDVSDDGTTIYGGARVGSVDGLIRSGLIKSTDGGRSWKLLDVGMAVNDFETIRMDPDRTEVAYAVAMLREGESKDVLLRTTDGGATWDVVAEDVGVFAMSRYDPTRLFYSESDGGYTKPGALILESTDRGESWAPLEPLPDDSGILHLIDRGPAGLLVSVASGRLFLSESGGRSWGEPAVPDKPWHEFVSVVTNSLLFYGATRGAGVQRLGASGEHGEPGSPAENVSLVRGAYPNPTPSDVLVSYELSASGPVSVDVYDLRGRLVRRLLRNEDRSSGEQTIEWDGRDALGRPLPSGVYFVEIRAAGVRDVTRVVIVR